MTKGDVLQIAVFVGQNQNRLSGIHGGRELQGTLQRGLADFLAVEIEDALGTDPDLNLFRPRILARSLDFRKYQIQGGHVPKLHRNEKEKDQHNQYVHQGHDIDISLSAMSRQNLHALFGIYR